MSLAATVLEYCSARSDSLTLQRSSYEVVTVVGEAPEYVGISLALIEDADPAIITWQGDRLRFDVQPEPLYYQPIFADLFRVDAVIVCKLVKEAGT